MFRIFLPQLKRIILTRVQDIREHREDKLPGVTSLLDDLSRQCNIESLLGVSGEAEELLHKAFRVYLPALQASHSTKYRRVRNDDTPRSFKEAVHSPAWREAIDREYQALLKRETWRFVHKTADMKPVPFTWVFKLQQLNKYGTGLLHKARCCIRGDKLQANIEYDPSNIYAPVVSHEAIRILHTFAAGEGLIMEGAYITNAYLYGNVDVPNIIFQPTDSSGVESHPVMVCILLKSLYGLWQAGEI